MVAAVVVAEAVVAAVVVAEAVVEVGLKRDAELTVVRKAALAFDVPAVDVQVMGEA